VCLVPVLVLIVTAVRADAEPLKCANAIARASAAFVKAQGKTRARCARGVVAGKIASCPDAKTLSDDGKAAAKLRKAVDKACGGHDKVCGGDRTAEDTPLSIGWPATCPNLEHGACTNTIDHCGAIAACIACTGGVAADRTIGLVVDDLALPSSGAVNACQATLAKASAAFTAARSRILAKCWEARRKGKHADDCIPPAVADGKYQDALAAAAAKQRDAVCKACGGADGACGTPDDLTLAAIGAPDTCPAVTGPDGAACGGPIAGLDGLVACLECVGAFETTCVDRLHEPAFTPYPPACNVCLAPPATGPCPTAFEFTADGPAVDLDTGWTGLAHDAKVPTNGRLTVAISGCTGTTQPACGECTVDGVIDNAGGTPFDNHRCSDASWVPCANDGDCVSAGAAGPCIYFFGAPLPLVAGGVPTCVLNRIGGPVGGTVNLDDGSSTTSLPLRSEVFVGGNTISFPCPVCLGGKCDKGTRTEQACTVQGTGELGSVSLDCPPAPSASVGTLTIDLNLATGIQTRTITAAQPPCTGSAGRRCRCDTCNSVPTRACSDNADCPPSGGNPGICGGRRCQLGSNAGAPCTVSSQCPGGGSCGRPGEATKPTACVDNTATPIDGSVCAVTRGDEGRCPEGPSVQVCSVERFRGCSAREDCNPPSEAIPDGQCPDCIPGQSCIDVPQSCFVDRGILNDAVHVSGFADAPCEGIAYPVVGSLFCVAPVRSDAVNTAGGLPGLGRVRIPGRVVPLP
jgi:hypothetical protein